MNLKVFKVSLNGSANSSCAQSPPPPRANGGFLSALSVPGVGHLQILRYPWAGHLPISGPLRAFDTHAVSHQNITTQRILLEKQAGWLIFQGREKMKRFVKACSRFYAYISSLLIKLELHSEIGSYRRETTCFLVIESNFY